MSDFFIGPNFAKAFINSMKLAQENLRKHVFEAVRRTAELAAGYAKVNTIFKSRTGELRSSIRFRAGQFGSDVQATAKHARWVEEGTKPHIITPRRKKWLRFEQNGAIRFSQLVHHPGTKPRPFMSEAQKKVEPLFERLCHEAIERMFG